jgi:hypothetical protein
LSPIGILPILTIEDTRLLKLGSSMAGKVDIQFIKKLGFKDSGFVSKLYMEAISFLKILQG